jgi:hypothetical protein
MPEASQNNFISRAVIAGCFLGVVSCVYSRVTPGDTLKLLNNLRLGVEAHYGYVYPHHSSIAYSLESRIASLELNVTTDTYGRGLWDELYRFPRMGAGYFYTSLGNNDVFGHAHALFLFMDVPFSSRMKKFRSFYRIGFGAAWLTKTFDVETNPKNIAISSGINMYVNFRYSGRLRLNDRNEIAAGFGFTHFSNGKLATPNLGINCVTLHAGWYVDLVADRYSRIVADAKKKLKKHSVEVILSGGTKTDDQISGNYYLISSLVVDYKYVPWMKYSFGAGMDVFYDRSLGPNKVGDVGGTYNRSDLYQLGMHAGFYSRYSKLTIVMQLGTYLYADYYKYSRIYSRIGIRYEVWRNILVNFSLKSHRATADFLEWGIGYRF